MSNIDNWKETIENQYPTICELPGYDNIDTIEDLVEFINYINTSPFYDETFKENLKILSGINNNFIESYIGLSETIDKIDNILNVYVNSGDKFKIEPFESIVLSKLKFVLNKLQFRVLHD